MKNLCYLFRSLDDTLGPSISKRDVDLCPQEKFRISTKNWTQLKYWLTYMSGIRNESGKAKHCIPRDQHMIFAKKWTDARSYENTEKRH